MAITQDQKSSLSASGSSLTSFTVTFTTKPAAGTKCILTMSVNPSDTGVITSIVDNGSPSRTFTQAKDKFASSCSASIWYADNVQPGGGTYTITITASSGEVHSAGAASYTNVATGAPTATNSGTASSQNVSSGTATPNAAGALFIGAYTDNSGSTETSTPLSSFTNDYAEVSGSSLLVGAGSHKIDAGGPTATAAAWTIGSDTPTWVAVVAVWDAAAAAGALLPPPVNLSQAVKRAAYF
jgi:hypothetical protein